MSMVVLASASGSPGVSTTALGLAVTWPRPVLLVEADPTGGSAFLAGFFRGQLTHHQGLVDLAWAHREGLLAETLPRLTVPVPDSQVQLLAGVRTHSQSRSVAPVWDELAVTLRGLAGTGQDVIVDAGRLGLAGSPEPLIAAADLMLLCLRTDLVALSAARSWVETLAAQFQAVAAEPRLRLLLIGGGRPYTAREVGKVLPAPVTATVAWDARSAAVWSHGTATPRKFDRARLPRSLRAAGMVLDAAARPSAALMTAESAHDD